MSLGRFLEKAKLKPIKSLFSEKLGALCSFEMLDLKINPFYQCVMSYI